MGEVVLTPEQEEGKQQVIAACRRSGRQETVQGDDWDAYAHLDAAGRICWGINADEHWECIARGVVDR